ncbi:MAG: competence/damage-inducible protein A [Acidimicrobiales bacterium]
MRAEVIAIGTELLLGQIVDTNSAWLGERLAEAGIDCLYQVHVGDNEGRIAQAIREAAGRADAVICCGGLGPTHDDVTRESLARAMAARLVRKPEQVARLQALFAAGSREVSPSNLRQADVPEGAEVIEQLQGTAPGLIAQVAGATVFALPGVPDEMKEMFDRAVLPILRARAPHAEVIQSRVLRTWGLPEAALAERLAERIAALDEEGNPTMAFLASGWEGIKVRISAKGTPSAATSLLDQEEREVRAVLGPVVFGTDDVGMEGAVAELLLNQELTLGLAESLTGGLMGARLTAVSGASSWFRGSIVSYATEVKRDVLDVHAAQAVSEEAAAEMAVGATRVLGADIGLAVTGVAGPEPADGQPAGTVWVSLARSGRPVVTRLLRLGRPFAHHDGTADELARQRQQIRQLTVISALDILRLHLLGAPDAPA